MMKDHGLKVQDHVCVTKEGLNLFEKWLIAGEYSSGTIEKYLRDMKKCGDWLGERPVDRDSLVAYKAFLMEKDLKPSTVNSVLSAMNTYCKFAGIPVRLNFLRIQKRLFRDDTKELTQKEYERLVRTAENKGDRRLALILETICSTGIRVSELQYITLEAVGCGLAQISLKGKVREILLPGKLCRKLRKYAKKEKITSGEIFVTKSGKGISRKQVWAEMKDLAEAAKVDPAKIFPHNLRHLFARVFYRVTGNLVRLSSLLGHSSIDTTRIYLQTGLKEHLSDLEKTGLVLLQ